MSATPELVQYITQARQDGMTDEQIRAELLTNGWSQVDVDAAVTPRMRPRSQIARVNSSPSGRAAQPGAKTNAIAHQAAKASWVSFIFAYGFAAMQNRLAGSSMQPFLLLAVPLFALIGVTLGSVALGGIRKHGTKGILLPGLLGIVLNIAVLLTIAFGFVSRLKTPG
jgi:hypothetical protein